MAFHRIGGLRADRLDVGPRGPSACLFGGRGARASPGDRADGDPRGLGAASSRTQASDAPIIDDAGRSAMGGRPGSTVGSAPPRAGHCQRRARRRVAGAGAGRPIRGGGAAGSDEGGRLCGGRGPGAGDRRAGGGAWPVGTHRRCHATRTSRRRGPLTPVATGSRAVAGRRGHVSCGCAHGSRLQEHGSDALDGGQRSEFGADARRRARCPAFRWGAWMVGAGRGRRWCGDVRHHLWS